jgi:hypothetical protein
MAAGRALLLASGGPIRPPLVYRSLFYHPELETHRRQWYIAEPHGMVMARTTYKLAELWCLSSIKSRRKRLDKPDRNLGKTPTAGASIRPMLGAGEACPCWD